jgi:nucleotide-binding universal stress UspA family protein
MKHILVATDLSPRADRAVGRAFRLADAHGARLTVLTVMDDAMPDRLAKVMRPETEAHLKSFCDSLSDDSRIAHVTRVAQGDPSQVIPETAAVIGADLVVLGLHRTRGFLDAIRETTLERTLRLTMEPVLLVRDPADHDYATVLAAVDFSPASTAAIGAVHRLAPAATIHGFHAVPVEIPRGGKFDPLPTTDHDMRDAEDARARWMDITALPGGMAPPRILSGGLDAVLDAEVARLKPQLIAVGAHARFSLTHRMLGSLARDLVRDPPADLLVARPGG